MYFMKLITTISLINVHHATQLHFFFLMRTSKIYFLSNYQIHNIVNCRCCAVHDIPGLTYPITGSLYILTPFTHFASPNIPASDEHQCGPCIYEFVFLFVFVYILYIREMIYYLTFSVWLINQHGAFRIHPRCPKWQNCLFFC